MELQSQASENPKTTLISLEDSRLQKVLLTNKLDDTTIALPKDVLPSGKVIFELTSKEQLQKPNLFICWWIATRAFSLTATAIPMIATLCLGLYQGWTPSWELLSLAFFGAVFFQLSINLFNDVEDHLKLIDLPGTFGGSGVIQKGWLSALEVRKVAFLLLGLGTLIGLPAVLTYPTLLWVIGLFGVLGVLAYSGWPFYFKYRALGDGLVFLMCGPALTLGFGLAAFGIWDPFFLWFGSLFGLLAMGILHANNLQDIPIDEKREAKTLASALGFSKARYGLAFVYSLTVVLHLSFVAFGFLPKGSLLGLLAMPLLFKISKNSILASGPYSPKLNQIRITTAQAHLVYGALTSIGLILSSFLPRSLEF